MKKKILQYSVIAASASMLISTNSIAQRLATRHNSSIYVCDEGLPMVWGYNGAGQFGNGSMATISNVPVASTGFESGDIITDVSAGTEFSLFLKDDNTLWTCGKNDFGQTGHVNQTLLPLQIAGHTGITTIGTGFYHAFFIKDDNTVWAFGRNDKGQLGDGNITGTGANPTPVQVLISDVTEVTGGFYHSIFLKSDSTVWHCGYTTANGVSTPIQFAGLSDVVAIAAGQYFSMFLKSDGTVWMCGNNQYGQFGNGSTSTNETDVPAQVPGLTGIVSIGAGDAFALFVKNDGTVWACGRNDKGQLGDGTTVDKHSPVQVLNISGVESVKAGYTHSLFAKSDGTLWGCGYNLLGQLGDGTNTDRLTPVQVINPNLCEVTASTPAAPSNLTATPTNSIELNWQDNSNDEDGFYIESTQDTVAGSWTQIATVGADTTTYLHTGLTNGVTYYYRVSAYNGNGSSSWSNIAGATDGATGIEDINIFNLLTIYPNPAKETVTIGNLPIGSTVNVTDITGKIVYSSVINSDQAVISTTDFVNGVYIIQVENNDAVSNRKLIVTK